MNNLQNIQQILEDVEDDICNVEVNISKIKEAREQVKDNKKQLLYYESQLSDLNKIHTNLINTRKYYYELYNFELLRRCCNCNKCKEYKY